MSVLYALLITLYTALYSQSTPQKLNGAQQEPLDVDLSDLLGEKLTCICEVKQSQTSRRALKLGQRAQVRQQRA